MLIINPELESIIRPEIEVTERLLWAGQPNPIRQALKALPVFFFAVPWTAFSIFWIAGAAGFKVPDFSRPGFFSFFPLFGLPFLFIGLGMLLSPVWVLIRAKRIYYTVTEKRCLIIKKGMSTTIRSINGQDISDIDMTVRNDGSGDIIFRSKMDNILPEPMRRLYNFTPNAVSSGQLSGFEGIKEVREVSRIINDTFRFKE